MFIYKKNNKKIIICLYSMIFLEKIKKKKNNVYWKLIRVKRFNN